jgi:purine-cytosine permease-like protein
MFVNVFGYKKLPILEGIAVVVYFLVFIALVRVALQVRSGRPLTIS